VGGVILIPAMRLEMGIMGNQAESLQQMAMRRNITFLCRLLMLWFTHLAFTLEEFQEVEQFQVITGQPQMETKPTLRLQANGLVNK
jgi:hypothetical protein